MPVTMESLGIDKLSQADRITLMHDIWDSLHHVPGSLLSNAQRAELERRSADMDANPDDFIPWEQVKAETEARMRRER